jgi:hypothetical protein
VSPHRDREVTFRAEKITDIAGVQERPDRADLAQAFTDLADSLR